MVSREFGKGGRAWAGPQSRRGGEPSCGTDQVVPATARPPFHLCSSFLLGPPFLLCLWVHLGGLGAGKEGVCAGSLH